MNKYLQIMRGTWDEYVMYRLNFVLWRVRMVMQVVVVYFLWSAIFSQRQGTPSGSQEFFGYTQTMMLTYILLTTVVRTFVLGTTTMEIGTIINQGDLSNFLIRPINFFRYYIAKDTADKLLNFCFAVFEIGGIILLLRPQVFVQTDIVLLILALIATCIGMVIYFSLSMTLSFLGFWTPDIWAPRFISFVVMEFFTGALFPLDILPKNIFTITQMLPFGYFIYFPLKVYTGSLAASAIYQGLFTGLVWCVVFWLIAQFVWRRGLKVYTAQGK